MAYEKFARELLSAPHLIACIHEDDVGSEHGITILYNEGTSFWKPLESKEEQQEVWTTLLQMRPSRLTEFDDVLFDPQNVVRVEIIDGGNGEPELVISFSNHKFLNDISFQQDNYTNFAQAYLELTELLANDQERRSNVFFKSNAEH